MRINRDMIAHTGTHAARIGGPVRKLAASRYVALPLAIALAAAIAISVAVAQPGRSGDDTDAGPRAIPTNPSAEFRATAIAGSVLRDDEILQEFIASGIEVDSLPLTRIMAAGGYTRRDLDTAVRDADIILRGTVTSQRMEFAPDVNFRSRIVSTVEMRNVVKGEVSDPTIEVEHFGFVTRWRNRAGDDEYVLATLGGELTLARGEDVVLFGATTEKPNLGPLHRPSGLPGRMLLLPGLTLKVDSRGLIDPDSRVAWVDDVAGRPADEVLQLLRDRVDGGP
jgi:hypothetical protein